MILLFTLFFVVLIFEESNRWLSLGVEGGGGKGGRECDCFDLSFFVFVFLLFYVGGENAPCTEPTNKPSSNDHPCVCLTIFNFEYF